MSISRLKTHSRFGALYSPLILLWSKEVPALSILTRLPNLRGNAKVAASDAEHWHIRYCDVARNQYNNSSNMLANSTGA